MQRQLACSPDAVASDGSSISLESVYLRKPLNRCWYHLELDATGIDACAVVDNFKSGVRAGGRPGRLVDV
jgi:hypothetical protein